MSGEREDKLEIEGLAAQLYVNSCKGPFCWWHVVNDEVKKKFRKLAKEKIMEYHKKNAEFDRLVTRVQP